MHYKSSILEIADKTNIRTGEILAKLKQERKKINCGSLIIHNRKSSTTFVENSGKKRKGITKDMERVYLLAHAEYLDALIEMYEHEHFFANKIWGRLKKKSFNRNAVNKVLRRAAGAGLDLRRVIWTPEQFEWSKGQSQNSFHSENLLFKTKGGVFMRSKSERELGNHLEDLLIPYWYEPEIEIDVTDFGEIKGAYFRAGRWYKTYYPDFVIMLSDGSLFAIEHLGRVDDSEYRISNSEKLMIYQASGVFDREHLLLTFESDLEDPETIYALLRAKVLPLV